MECNLPINLSKSHIISSLIVAHCLTNPHLNTGCSINFYILTCQKLFGESGTLPCPTCSVDQDLDRIGFLQVFNCCSVKHKIFVPPCTSVYYHKVDCIL